MNFVDARKATCFRLNGSMRASDWLILRELEKIEALIIAQQAQTNARLDDIDRKLNTLLQGIPMNTELETAIKGVAAQAVNIDQKVPDKP